MIVLVPLPPCPTETEFGEEDIEKPDFVTVRVTEVVFVSPPPVPVTVIG